MTRKDYFLIASVVREIEDPNVRASTARAFCGRLLLDNERFDSVRFLTACRVSLASIMVDG